MIHLGKNGLEKTPPDAHDTNVSSEAHLQFLQVAWKINSTQIHHKMRPGTMWVTSCLAILVPDLGSVIYKMQSFIQIYWGLRVLVQGLVNTQKKHPTATPVFGQMTASQ